MKQLLFVLMAATGLFVQAASKGSCESKADSIKIGGAKSVKLVDEYDPDDGEYWGTGAYYLEVTLTRGKAYTLWLEGGSMQDIGLTAYPRDTTEKEDEKDIWSPMASFDDDQEQGNKHVYWLYSDDWDAEDPASWKYYICLDGDIGLSTTVHLVEGYQSFLEEGLATNPAKITVGDGVKKYSKTITEDGDFHFQATLTAGRKYFVRTTGGTEAKPFSLSVESDADFSDVVDPDRESDPFNGARIVYPETSGTYEFVVVGGVQGDPFGFETEAVPMRQVGEHESRELADGSVVSFVPGRVVQDERYYDVIADENLFRVSVQKGERWVFDAPGADREVKMRVYDAKGAVVASNDTIGDGSRNVRCALSATSAGTWYVSVVNLALGPKDSPVGAPVTLTVRRVASEDPKAVALSALPAKAGDDPAKAGSVSGPYAFGADRWSQDFTIAARKGVVYVLSTAFADEQTLLSLKAELYQVSGSSLKKVALSDNNLTPGAGVSFEATSSAQYLVRVSVAEGQGLDYPAFSLYAMAYTTDGQDLGILQVVTKGVSDATWTIDKESTKYTGSGSLLLAGTHTVKFAAVKGFSVTADPATVTVKPGTEPTVVTGVYNDAFDPKDDASSGATKLTVSAKGVSAVRTLWSSDKADWFVFSAKDGVYHNFALADMNEGGDAVLSVLDAKFAPVAASAEKVASVSRLPLLKGTYYVRVEHGTEAKADSSYTLVADSANVGAISFAKTAVSAKEDAASVKLSVKRSAKEGKVRVLYGTVAGTAQPGVDYIAQQGELVWENGDSKAKTIEVKLIPDEVATYEGNKQFQVRLMAVEPDDLAVDEYPALIAGGDAATITLTETAKPGVSPYKPVKKATGSEKADFWVGKFSGVLAEDGSALTNGFPALAQISFTATAADKLTAKVTVAGKTYSFAAQEWDDKDPTFGCTKEFELEQKFDGEIYLSYLTVTVGGGRTTDADAYLTSGGTAELVLNVPDAKGGGFQEAICYSGELVRDNAKVQNYLDKVVDYAGYYTVSLVPDGVAVEDGVPTGYGYLTLTLDNKGAAKVAGILADGTTKISAKGTAAIREDGTLSIPVFQAKSPYCFGGTLRLFLQEQADGTTVPVVDSTSTLVWNNDNAALTRDNEEGWRISVVPVGGWYDTVVNLQTHYLTTDLTLDGVPVAVSGNNVTIPKNATGESVSALTFSFKRATGLSSGKLTYGGSKSLKHFGVLLLSRDEAAPLDETVVIPGAFTRTVTEGRRKYAESFPFVVLGEDLGDPDWWADDWGMMD